MSSNADLIAQLRSLLQLTQAEEQVARLRVIQARTEAVERELTRNADNAARRSEQILAELRRLGGVADVVSPLVGRVAAVVKGTLDQGGPIDEALLGDLTLEHQLLDRAVYLRSLAHARKDTRVQRLADQLVTAHTATVDWLTTVLAEHALGGPPALRPTAIQQVAGGATRAVSLPVRYLRDQLSRLAARTQQTGEQARAAVADTAERASRISRDARDVAVAGRDAALERAETLSREEGNRDAAQALHDARTRLGALHESELPITGYDRLGVDDAVKAIKKLDEVEDLNKVIVYEEANKDRQGVVSAAQTRHAALAKQTAGVDQA